MDKIFRYAGIIKADIANGTGVGVTLFTQGCSHHCAGCHNPETWNPDGGKEFTDKSYNSIVSYVRDNKYIDHITLSGGEPFENIELCKAVIDGCKKERPEIKVWCYTGYTFEEILNNHKMSSFLTDIDTLVDGMFIECKKDTSLPFRGSSNQRIIDVKKSLETGRGVCEV